MIDEMRLHYSFTHPASVHDEEALTALELAGRQGAKINEIIRAQNQLKTDTENKMKEQDVEIDEAIAGLPSKVKAEVQRHIDDGSFSEEIAEYNQRIDNELTLKIDSRDNGVVGMNMLTEEVKQAMTGGSVAVVGADTVSDTNVIHGSLSADRMNFADLGCNLLNRHTYESNKAWGRGKNYKTEGEGTTAFEVIPLKAGVCYYFYNVRGYFSHVIWDDGTVDYFSGNQNASYEGYRSATQNGKAYITVDTDDLATARVFNYYAHVQTANNDKVLIKNFLPSFDFMKQIGFRYTKRMSGENFNGGTLDTLNNQIIIDSGYKGTNTYIMAQFPEHLNGKKVLFALNYTQINESSIWPRCSTALVNLGGGVSYAVDSFNKIEKDGSFTDYIYGEIPNDTTGAQLFLQIKNTVVQESTATIRVNGLYYLYEDGLTELLENLNGLAENGGATRYVTVDKNGNGDYTTLRACLEDIKPTKALNYVVYVTPDTYELRDEYYEDEWNDEEFKGLFVPDYCTIKGKGNREDVIIQATYDAKHTNASTLNLSGTASLENLTVIGNKTRYAVHDDFATMEAHGYKRVVKNCTFIGNDTYYNNTYGTGTKQGAEWLFENCEFINNNDGVAFSNHNNVGFELTCSIQFKNCRFYTEGANAVRFGSLNNNANGILTYVTFAGCKFTCLNHAIRLFEENVSKYGAGILFKVGGYANKGVTFIVENTDGKSYGGCFDFV